MKRGFTTSFPMALLAILVGAILLSLPYVQCLGDDTFIYMRMIRNFLQTGRFEYNVGEACYAMTSVTWFLAWAGGTALLGSMDAARYVLSLVCHVLAFLGMYLLGRRIICNRLVVFLAMATVFMDPFYLRWFWAGWEVSPKIAAAAWALYALVRAGSDARRGTVIVAGLAGGLAFLTRPEMLIVLPLGLCYLGLRFDRGCRVGGILGYVAAFCLVVLPWLLYSYTMFGWLLPHTVFAKSGESLTWRYAGKFVGLLVVPCLPLYGLVAVAALRLVRTHGAEPIRGLLRLTLHKLDILLVFVFGAGVLGYVVFGSFIEQIKIALFTPFLVLTAAAVLDWMVQRYAIRLAPRMAVLTILATLGLSLAIQAPWLVRYSYFNHRFREGEDREFIAFARKVKEMTPPSSKIALWELGVVGYYTDRYIIDFAGLATPGLTVYKLRYPLTGRSETDELFKRMPEYVNAYVRDTGQVPDYIVECVPQGLEETHGKANRELFGRMYTPIYSHRAERVFMRLQPRDCYFLLILYQCSHGRRVRARGLQKTTEIEGPVPLTGRGLIENDAALDHTRTGLPDDGDETTKAYRCVA